MVCMEVMQKRNQVRADLVGDTPGELLALGRRTALSASMATIWPLRHGHLMEVAWRYYRRHAKRLHRCTDEGDGA